MAAIVMEQRRAQWHHTTFGQWLAHHRQPRRVVDQFWTPVIVSALNEWPDRVAADYTAVEPEESELDDDEWIWNDDIEDWIWRGDMEQCNI